MINQQLINPKSIVVIGGSNDLKKPGGKIVKNILDGNFSGDFFIVNHHEREIQGNKCFADVDSLPKVDLAIIVIPAVKCYPVIETLVKTKETKAFIILSAGFGEAGDEGVRLENEIVSLLDQEKASLIGPNCIGILNENYQGIFTTPIPKTDKNGCDLISSSGATAVFIMEAGIPLGLKFSNVYSVGNAAQTSVEDVLEYMDENFDEKKDSKIKLLYLETIKDPQKLLKHASSLIKKGVRIAAIKSGSTDTGSRAAASHTGAIATSDVVVRSLLKKAGIVYCSGRDELISVASIFNYKELQGKNIGIITHAGGSAVMLADKLASSGLNVPEIKGPKADKLLTYLYSGSSVSNPIDFLATGTAEQLSIIIDYCEHKFDEIDAMVVVFGSPGLFDVENVYNVLSVKLDVCSKPIFPVLPSLINAQKEIKGFLANGNVNFPDEVVLARALSEVYHTPKPSEFDCDFSKIDKKAIRKIIDACSDGFLNPLEVGGLLDAVGIPRVEEYVCDSQKELDIILNKVKFPVVMKVVGPLHKTDIGGVELNIQNKEHADHVFEKFMKLKNVTGVMVQNMLSGQELFVGVKKEEGFGHTVLCGLGGIMIEVLNDISACLSPVSYMEAEEMVQSLKSYKIIQGIRGREGVNEKKLIKAVVRISALVEVAPEITELDMNPLLGNLEDVVCVDARICISKK